MDTTNNPDTAKNLTTLAFEQLRADILSCHWRPGERLRIQALHTHYGIGATALREALSRLVSEGLVASLDQRGFLVAPASRAELLDLTQTRIDVACQALRKSMALGDLEWESALLGSFHRLSRTALPVSPEEWVPWSKLHRQFHDALLAGCQSPWLLRVCALLDDQAARYRNLAGLALSQAERDIAAEHQALLNATMARDAVTACRLLARHFQATADAILESGLRDSEPASAARRRPD